MNKYAKLKSINRLKYYFFLGFTLFLILLRAFTLIYKLPNFLFSSSFFNPNIFAISYVSPSIGDLFINSILLLIWVVVLNKIIGKTKFGNAIQNQPTIIVFFCLLFAFTLLKLYFDLLNQFYLGSQFLLDLKLNLSFLQEDYRLISIVIFLVSSATFYIANHIIFKQINEIDTSNFKRKHVFEYSISILLAIIFAAILNIPFLIIIIFCLYLALIYIFKLSKNLSPFQDKTTIYLTLTVVLYSFIGTYVAFRQEKLADFENKQKIARALLQENNPLTEILINKKNKNIENDFDLRKILMRKDYSISMIEKIIMEKHLNDWQKKYEIEISIINSIDKFLEADTTIHYNKTLFQNLLRTNNRQTNSSEYFQINYFTNYSEKVVILLIKLREKYANSLSFYDQINQIEKPLDLEGIEYEIFNKNKLVSSNTSENWTKDLNIGDNEVFKSFVTIKNKKICGYKASEGNFILLGSDIVSPWHFYQNFSFLFLILIILNIVVLTIYSAISLKNSSSLKFSSKIQIYLGLTFLIPFFITITIIFQIINNNYEEIQKLKFLKLGQKLIKIIDIKSKNLKLNETDNFKSIVQFTKENECDINGYSSNGNLIFASNSYAKSKGQVENKLNSKELVMFLEKNSNYYLQKSTLNNTVFYQYFFKVFENKKLSKVIGLPFAQPDSFKNEQTLSIIGSLINAFATIFISLLLVSILLAKALVRPLKIITSGLKKTDINLENKPLIWNAKDEIGLLVVEYNKMLENIESGKKILSQNEKQTAWQDIAKQVAHEIKNPLTPITLNLQHLSNILERDKPIQKENFQKSINNILVNINNVTDIVNSFSEFARMPLPKTDLVDLVVIMKNLSNFYAVSEDITIVIEKKIKSAKIIGDNGLIWQILTNLIINARQSVSDGHKPEIEIKLKTIEKQAIICVSDNGIGIPLLLQDKIFLPNFTTKSEGQGIGLSLAKWAIENQKGSIWFETEQEKGTKFYIELPLI